MDDVLDETLYQDDFLNRTLNTSTLYEKPNLDLSFIGNDNIDRKHSHHTDNGAGGTPDSPDLDFLKFGSPDLEQMFLSIDVNEDTSLSNEEGDVTSAAFSIEEDLVSAENCFTEALQHLHDKNESLPVDLLDITFKPDIENEAVAAHLNANSKQCKNAQANDIIKSRTNINNNNNNNIINNNNNNNPTITNNNHLHLKQHAPSLSEIRQQMYHSDALNNNQPIPSKTLHHQERTNLIPGPPHHHQHNMPPLATTDITTVLPEQIAINNQIALINSMNQSMNAHQLHQQQQELAFLTQAMGFQADRDTIQSHINMNGGYPQHMNQMPPHIQQKFIEQQMIHQQMNGGFHGSENNPQLSNMGHIDSVGIDEHTLKMFVENPHLAPMNLDIQELIKRERKKLRNRIASSKCRKRKLEREGRLEDKVKTLKEKNIELNAVANALKQQICDLKQRVMDHVGEGCQIVLPS